MAYTPEFKANVLVGIKSNGGNIEATAFQFGIPRTTIYRWLNENVAQKELADEITKVEGEFVEDLRELRNKVLHRVVGLVDEMTAKEATVALGILIDKIQLLTGQATDRREIIGNGESVDEAIKRLSAELESRPDRIALPEVASSDQGDSKN
jgi:transposase-like protein